jgi:hypothetical protein
LCAAQAVAGPNGSGLHAACGPLSKPSEFGLSSTSKAGVADPNCIFCGGEFDIVSHDNGYRRQMNLVLVAAVAENGVIGRAGAPRASSRQISSVFAAHCQPSRGNGAQFLTYRTTYCGAYAGA